MSYVHALSFAAVAAMASSGAYADWDPANAKWGKTDGADLRVMTWNVRDGVCSSNAKIETRNDWCALVRIVAAMQPDVLILQETGDNSGNGTGSGLDSEATLRTVVGLFLRGGNDPFRGNAPVTSWVQKYAPSFDMPYVFVSSENDGFNRNVILSRYPFADLNGDTLATYSDCFFFPDQYAQGIDGGIRGFAYAEIDLPDSTYAGNLVMGCSHLKSGSDSTSMSDRIRAAQNIAYFIDYWYNGAGSGIPDPNNVIRDVPPATRILDAATPVIWGGDLNEDENSNSRKGPAEWMTAAALIGGTDGTDRDRTDSRYDDAREFFSGSRATFGSTTKLDYILHQDSIANLRRAFVFNSAEVPATSQPPEVRGFQGGDNAVSGWASDHRPVVADFVLPLVPDCAADFNGDGTVDSDDFFDFLNAYYLAEPSADFNGDGTVDSDDFFDFLNAYYAGC